MRYMIMVRATTTTEAGVFPSGQELEDLMDRMARYHEELARAGVLLDASGLQPSAAGWRIRYDGKSSTVIDGPFAEAKEMIAGYTLIEVGSRDEALAWTRRFPNPATEGQTGEIEVRPLYDLEDLPEAPGRDRFRDLELPSQK